MDDEDLDFRAKWLAQRKIFRQFISRNSGYGGVDDLLNRLVEAAGASKAAVRSHYYNNKAPSRATYQAYIPVIAQFLHEMSGDKTVEEWKHVVFGSGPAETSISPNVLQRNLADSNLKADRAAELLKFYHAESPVELSVGNEKVRLPLVWALEPDGRGGPAEQKTLVSISPESQYQIPAFLSETYRAVEKRALALDHSNGDVVRLENASRRSGKTRITLRKAKYFEALATNYNMDSRQGNPPKSLREIIHGQGRLCPELSKDPLVNNIGVVIMVESTDGFLVAQERSGNVANRAYTRSASASGAVTWRQLGKAARGAEASFECLVAAAQDHVWEELAIELDAIYFLGLFRELLRGGKPELYFYGKSSLTFDEIRERLPNAVHRGETTDLTRLEFRNVSDARVELSRKQSFEFRVSSAFHAILESANMTLIAGLLLTAAHVRKWEMNA